MTQLIGEYHCKLDAKGRITIPAALRRQIPSEADEKLVINRGFEPCLVLYPSNEWKSLAEELQSKNQFKADVRKFVRWFFRGATILDMDGASRINLPNTLLAHAEIKKEVVLFAHTNQIEVWDKEKYYALFDEDPESFSDLAESVMDTKSSET